MDRNKCVLVVVVCSLTSPWAGLCRLRNLLHVLLASACLKDAIDSQHHLKSRSSNINLLIASKKFPQKSLHFISQRVASVTHPFDCRRRGPPLNLLQLVINHRFWQEASRPSYLGDLPPSAVVRISGETGSVVGAAGCRRGADAGGGGDASVSVGFAKLTDFEAPSLWVLSEKPRLAGELLKTQAW